jgi:hypothetical protein
MLSGLAVSPSPLLPSSGPDHLKCISEPNFLSTLAGRSSLGINLLWLAASAPHKICESAQPNASVLGIAELGRKPPFEKPELTTANPSIVLQNYFQHPGA